MKETKTGICKSKTGVCKTRSLALTPLPVFPPALYGRRKRGFLQSLRADRPSQHRDTTDGDFCVKGAEFKKNIKRTFLFGYPYWAPHNANNHLGNATLFRRGKLAFCRGTVGCNLARQKALIFAL